MSPNRRKLRLAGAFATLLIFALGVGCTGFFVNPTVSSITVDPPTPTVGFGQGATTIQMTAVATYNDGSTGNLTGGTSCTGSVACWSSSDTSVATISTGGVLTGVSAGTATITAASGSVTGTTTATVAETVSSMTINPPSAGVPADGSTAATFTIDGTTQSGTQNISALVTLAASLSGTASTDISCAASTGTNGEADQSCTAATGTTPGAYTLTVTYGGYTGAPVTATLNVTAPPS
jgi:trimeric autotransporter adhesin